MCHLLQSLYFQLNLNLHTNSTSIQDKLSCLRDRYFLHKSSDVQVLTIKHLNNKYNETKEQFNLLLASSEENPDDEKSVAFYDENFCLFKDFPHENFVFPVFLSLSEI